MGTWNCLWPYKKRKVPLSGLLAVFLGIVKVYNILDIQWSKGRNWSENIFRGEFKIICYVIQNMIFRHISYEAHADMRLLPLRHRRLPSQVPQMTSLFSWSPLLNNECVGFVFLYCDLILTNRPLQLLCRSERFLHFLKAFLHYIPVSSPTVIWLSTKSTSAAANILYCTKNTGNPGSGFLSRLPVSVNGLSHFYSIFTSSS